MEFAMDTISCLACLSTPCLIQALIPIQFQLTDQFIQFSDFFLSQISDLCMICIRDQHGHNFEITQINIQGADVYWTLLSTRIDIFI